MDKYSRAQSLKVSAFYHNSPDGINKPPEPVDSDERGYHSIIIEEPPDQEDSYTDVDQKFSIQNTEELGYQVPIKLYTAAQNLLKKISHLPTDEYGDQYYDGDNLDDKWSQKLKRAGEIMMYWLNKLFNSESLEDMERVTQRMKTVIKYDKSFQVDLDKSKLPFTELRNRFANVRSNKALSGSFRYKSRPPNLKMVSKGRRSLLGSIGYDLLTPTNQVTKTIPFNFQSNSK